MSVSPIGTSSTVPDQQPSTAQTSWQNMLNSMAGTLGLSTSALQQKLQSGQSLSSTAEAQGVSQQSLLQSISTSLTQNGSTASGSQLQQLATNIANRTGGAGQHHLPGAGAGTGASSGSQQSFISTLLQAMQPSGSTSASSASSTDPLTSSPLSATASTSSTPSVQQLLADLSQLTSDPSSATSASAASSTDPLTASLLAALDPSSSTSSTDSQSTSALTALDPSSSTSTTDQLLADLTQGTTAASELL